MPHFFSASSDEVDHIYTTFDKEWNEAFSKNGYVLLGWAEVGFVYVFTKKPIQNLSELKANENVAVGGRPDCGSRL